ncbi:GIY-YIG nuclease family protein [Candidatus Peregrinibacteria bacterium]|nr:GIY-YIG nuclease family protein [Candidatus Peregrinibacteria bacterium]
MHDYFVYIISNIIRSTLCIGVTNNLERRMYEHKKGIFEGFSKKYNLRYLMYFEEFSDIYEAIVREKQLKKWKRAWKNKLIENFNPKWEDLSEKWL